jgi:hypothetical protein
MAEASPRPNFYDYSHESISLDNFVREQVRLRLDRRRASILDDRNIHSYRHGDRWALEASTDEVSQMHSMGAESTVHTIDIINHETSLLETFIETMVEQLHGGVMKHLFQTVGEAAEKVGNTVSRKDYGGDFAAGFFAMLEKIEFGVDRYGSANRPSIYVHPSEGDKLLSALLSQPIEYHTAVETLSTKKEKGAIAREARRISNFRWKRN